MEEVQVMPPNEKATKPLVAAAEGVAVVDAVPWDNPVFGAITSGPTQVGKGISVCGKAVLPGQFTISGDRYSVVNRELQPGESFQGEPGVMMYMSSDVKMKARFAGWRIFTGEGLAKVKFTNTGSEPGFLGLTPNMPMAIVLPFDVGSLGGLNCKRGAFMAGDDTVRVHPKILPARSCTACCCGGMAPIIQHISGGGTALLNAGGTVIQKDLEDGEEILVDSDAVVAFTDNITYDVRQVGTLITCCCSGEGCFNTSLKGPGTVYLQTLSYEKLIRQLVKIRPAKGKDGEGTIEGGEGAPLTNEDMER